MVRIPKDTLVNDGHTGLHVGKGLFRFPQLPNIRRPVGDGDDFVALLEEPKNAGLKCLGTLENELNEIEVAVVAFKGGPRDVITVLVVELQPIDKRVL